MDKDTHKIEINDFGPITNINLVVTDLVFLLGEQASGKSTVAKLVYFFRTFQDEFVRMIFMNGFEEWQNCRAAYVSILRKKFTNIFGPTKDLGKFKIKYCYSSRSYVEITPNEENKVNVDLKSIIHELSDLWKDAKRVLTINKQNALDLYAKLVDDSAAKKDILSRTRNLFNDECYSLYIPAGRALLSRQALKQLILGNELRFQDETYRPFDILDAPTRNYIDEVDKMRGTIPNNEINGHENSKLEFMLDASRGILKGSYAYVNNYDYVKISDHTLVPLSYASSGQQEVVWLLNLLFAYAKSRRRCFVVIEEPETHLHPDAQYLLAQYIAAFRNITESVIFITTHSPYVLSSFNNLFYAGECGASNESAANNVIKKESWLAAKDFSSYIMEKGIIRNIKDEELVMVDIAELDAVASKQDTEYEKLLQIIREGGLV